jgi:serine/threonine protein kinase/tetratricopeptide (TPR) repeat protein
MPGQNWEHIQELFLAAADLPRDQQDHYLRSACDGDPELYWEVQSLLACDRGSADTLAGAIEREAQELLDVHPLIGTRLGAYRVLREIGRGGMGSVYLAVRDDDVYQKQVAIKVVKRGMDSEAVVDRFRHERRILASLDHPYIAKMLDGGTGPDGRPYFVMEYVQGRSITSFCKEHDLSIEQRCDLFRKVCEAVAYAHRALVIHRDLKPGNILVGEDGIPKLLDFGIAKVLSPEADTDPVTVTLARMRLATPEYASPEQFRGERVTTSTDIYSLGVVLYELLTGTRPYARAALTLSELERAICETDPTRPSAAAPASGRSFKVLGIWLRNEPTQIEGDLDNIVLKALRKEPERRYRSVDELNEDVRRYVTGLPVAAGGDRFSYRAGKFLKRHRVGVMAASVAVLSLVIGAAVAIREARVADQQRRRAEQRLQQMVELANRSLFDIHGIIERLPGATEARREIVKTTVDFLDKLAHENNDDPGVRQALASAYMRVGDVQGLPEHPNLGDTQGALASYRRARDLYRAVAAQQPDQLEPQRQLLELESHMAAVLDGMNRNSESRALLGDAILRNEPTFARNPGDEAFARALGEAYLQSALVGLYPSPKQGAATAQKAAGIFEKLAVAHPGDREILKQVASSYSALGGALVQSGDDLPRALRAFQKELAIYESLAGRYPNDALIRRELMISNANVADVMGDPYRENLHDFRGAAVYYRKMIAAAEAGTAADPKNSEARYDLVQALLRYGYSMTAPEQAAASVATLRRAVAVADELHRADPANEDYLQTAVVANIRLGKRLRQVHDQHGALAAYARAHDVAERQLKQEPTNQIARNAAVDADRATAVVLAEAGDRSAIRYIERAVAETEDYARHGDGSINFLVSRPTINRSVGHIYDLLAQKSGNQADWRHACAAYREALAEFQPIFKMPGGDKFTGNFNDVKTALAGCEKRLAGR